MLRIVTGPFHPDLEAALVSSLRALKRPDPLAPVAIIVPSDALRDRLKRVLCIEQGQSLVNVHLLTFYQLALRLLSDERPFDASRLQPSVYFHELVRGLLRRQPPGTAWHGLAETPGAWAALFATLKDLKDAAVDPDRVADAWTERGWGPAPDPAPVWLLYRQFLETRRQLAACDADDLAAMAAARAPRSTFLARLHHVAYYGFYDLTQVQLDLFRAVTAHAATTVFFPLLDGHPDFAFAQRFFDSHIRGLDQRRPQVHRGAASGVQLPLFDSAAEGPAFVRSSRSAAKEPAPRVLSAGSPLDEVTTVAKDILMLVEERGYDFGDIGVVARSLSGYDDLVARVFAEQGVPVATDLGGPLAAWPSVTTVLQLFAVRAGEFHREDVLELLASPCLDHEAICPEPHAARPDWWALIARRLGITKGRTQWERLTQFLDRDFPLRDSEEDGAGPVVPAKQVGLFWQTFTRLAETLATIPDRGSWTEFVERMLAVSSRLVRGIVSPDGVPVGAVDPCVFLHEVLDQLRRLDEFSDPVSFGDCFLTVQRLVEAARLPRQAEPGSGVQILDAMAARGLSFRALYVLGLNEKVFPRFIHEDAFLRDAVRHILEQDLGYKIQAKITGYEEERLLFSLLRRAAREEWVLSYLRADGAGRPLVPSGYLAQLSRDAAPTELTIPRRPAAKFDSLPQFRPACLTAAELTTRWLFDRAVPTALLTRYPGGAWLPRSLSALRAHERMGHRLGAHDGLIGAESAYWTMVRERGLSPSALQRYATCPFQFFAASALRLEPDELETPMDPIGPLEQGTLVHGILRRWMEALTGAGFFTDSRPATLDPMTGLDRCARDVFTEYERTHPVGYAVTWELRQQELLALLHEALPHDLADLAHGWEPRLFEYPVKGTLAVNLAAGPTEVPLTGRLDRVDWSPVRRAFRIVDYKFKRSKAAKGYEKNLALGAVRGFALQPPLYLVMAEAGLPQAFGVPSAACDGVWFYYLAPDWEPRWAPIRFPGDAWRSSLQPVLVQSLTRILSGIRDGTFFIAPHESVCARCDFGTICRKTHQSSAWRARADLAAIQSHRDLRRTPLPMNGQPSGACDPPEMDAESNGC